MKEEVGNITLIGSSHASNKSVQEIKETIDNVNPELIGVELDKQRYAKILNNNETKTSILKLFSSPLTFFLSHIQKIVGNRVGVTPGSDMKKAVEMANDRDKEIILLDRDIRITMRKVHNNLSLLDKIKIFSILLFCIIILKALHIKESILNRKDKNKSKNKIKDDSIMEYVEDFERSDVNKSLEEMKKFPKIYKPIVEERDIIMATKLSNYLDKDKKVVAVVGAAHLPGITKNLKQIQKELERKEKTKDL